MRSGRIGPGTDLDFQAFLLAERVGASTEPLQAAASLRTAQDQMSTIKLLSSSASQGCSLVALVASPYHLVGQEEGTEF